MFDPTLFPMIAPSHLWVFTCSTASPRSGASAPAPNLNLEAVTSTQLEADVNFEWIAVETSEWYSLLEVKCLQTRPQLRRTLPHRSSHPPHISPSSPRPLSLSSTHDDDRLFEVSATRLPPLLASSSLSTNMTSFTTETDETIGSMADRSEKCESAPAVQTVENQTHASVDDVRQGGRPEVIPTPERVLNAVPAAEPIPSPTVQPQLRSPTTQPEIKAPTVQPNVTFVDRTTGSQNRQEYNLKSSRLQLSNPKSPGTTAN